MKSSQFINQSARFIESPFVLVSKTPIDSGVWTNENRLNMSVKPNAVDIIVHHLGVVIDKATGNLEYLNHLTIIDTFTISLRDYQATVYGTSPNIVKKSIRGQILGTSLQVVYSVQCIGDKNGPSCDLVCAPAPSNKRCAACVSTLTGMQISCKYLGSSITNCIPCPLNLTKDGTECVTPRIDQTEQDLVSSVFRIWTIVLGCLLGIAILLIIFLVIIFAIIQKREKAWRRSRQYAGMTYSIEPSRAFLSQENDEWHRSKIKATISGSRTETTEEPTEDEYVRSGVVPVIRREAHV
ncbi:unnamed protein product [Thelazia callipaeda]|uniref:LAM_G_DOMAIN domain-containing protein n=1 Tax=Thelazia callipaeda TaxID=103827 RepID=A0A0N5CYQ9_THECL|nr:unnamed protein product [Thelazia callipaeda]